MDATGRNAVFAVAQGAERVFEDQLVGVCGIFRSGTSLKDTYTLVEAEEHGW